MSTARCVPILFVFAFSTACGTRIADGISDSEDQSASLAESDEDGEPSAEQTNGSAETWTDPDFPVPCQPGVNDCPEGEKCQPYLKDVMEQGVDATMCVPLTGDQRLGEDCLRERYGDDCAKDLWCFAGVSAKEGPGVCRQLCEQWELQACQDDKGLPHHVCVSWESAPYALCFLMCHPLQSDCDDEDPECFPECAEDEGCFLTRSGFYGYMCNVPDIGEGEGEGEGEDGDACPYEVGCVAGLQCLGADELEGCENDWGSCCTPDCDLSDDGGECPADTESCISPFRPNEELLHPAYADVGVCAVAS